MHEALFYQTLENKTIRCDLCPNVCFISPNKYGICKIRKNENGILYAETYGKISAAHFDPVEKKPLYHFHSGKKIFSIGSVGCNLKCLFCQNSEISQRSALEYENLYHHSVKEIVELATKRSDNIGIAYTYNEPTVNFEFVLDTAKMAKTKNLKNVVVSNGYINEKPLLEMLEVCDAFNIDLKSFSDDFYKQITFSKLENVKNTLKTIRKSKKHLEITCLIIPTLNDDEKVFEEMSQWISAELGNKTVLHISRYFPRYKMNIPETPIPTLLKLYEIASKYLKFVYLGNTLLNKGNDTTCDKCGKIAISREGYSTYLSGITVQGNCQFCGNKIVEY